MSLGEWFFYAVCTGTFGYVIVGTLIGWVRAVWQFLKQL